MTLPVQGGCWDRRHRQWTARGAGSWGEIQYVRCDGGAGVPTRGARRAGESELGVPDLGAVTIGHARAGAAAVRMFRHETGRDIGCRPTAGKFVPIMRRTAVRHPRQPHRAWLAPAAFFEFMSAPIQRPNSTRGPRIGPRSHRQTVGSTAVRVRPPIHPAPGVVEGDVPEEDGRMEGSLRSSLNTPKAPAVFPLNTTMRVGGAKPPPREHNRNPTSAPDPRCPGQTAHHPPRSHAPCTTRWPPGGRGGRYLRASRRCPTTQIPPLHPTTRMDTRHRQWT